MLLVEDSISKCVVTGGKMWMLLYKYTARWRLWCMEGRIWGEHSLVPRPHPPGKSGLVSMFAHARDNCKSIRNRVSLCFRKQS